jgi:hypothetical protein
MNLDLLKQLHGTTVVKDQHGILSTTVAELATTVERIP